MKTNKIILFCVFAFAGLSSYAQIKVIQTSEQTAKFENVRNTIYFDAEGKETTAAKQNEFLAANIRYRMAIRIEEDGKDLYVIVQKIIPDEEEVIGKVLPTLTYPDFKGNKVSVIDGEKPFLLCFWSTSCSNCIVEINILNQIASEFPNIRIVAIADQKHSVIKEFMDKHNLQWNNITIISDYQNDYIPIIQSTVYPTTLLVSKSGIIKNVYYGSNMRHMIVGMDELDKSCD